MCIRDRFNGLLHAAIGGRLQTYDLASQRRLGSMLITRSVEEVITGMAVESDVLYLMDSDRKLHSVDVSGFVLNRLGTLAVSDGGGDLFVGGGVAYAAAANNARGGYATVDVSDPTAMTEISGSDVPSGFVAPRGAIVPNGSGLGLLIGTSNRSPAVDLMDVSNPQDTNEFLVRFPLQTAPRDVAIGAGIAFIANGGDGLQVVNYLAFDSFGIDPSVSMEVVGLTEGGEVEEGKQILVKGTVADDVQGRDVEFYLDGERVAADVSFPFEQPIVAPLSDKGKREFALQLRVSDTGGNVAWSDELVIPLTDDATAPNVLGEFPEKGSAGGASDGLGVFLNEPVQESSLRDPAMSVIYAGEDQVVGTSDDQEVPLTFPVYRDEAFSITARFLRELEPGLYRATLHLPVVDLANNPLNRPHVWQFWVMGSRDLDGDGFPDSVEPAFGLDPTNPDTDGNGVLDGDEDPDGDGIPSGIEVLAELDPTMEDSDLDGVLDGDEDSDQDSLVNLRELEIGTSIALSDTDADLWNDENEVAVASDPLDTLSFPSQILIAAPITELVIPSPLSDGRVVGTVYGSPVVELNLPKPQGVGSGANGIVYGRPTVELNLPVPSERAGGGSLSAYGRPVVELNIPATSSGALSATKTQMGRPEVIVIIGDDLHIQ